MNMLDVQWGRFLSYAERTWSSHVDHTLPPRALQILRATRPQRWGAYVGPSHEYGAYHLLGDLAVKSIAALAPGGWQPPPAELLRERNDGLYDILISTLVARNEDQWLPELARRAGISGGIAGLALLPEEATRAAALVPLDPLHAFHRPGPALSWYGILHELRESVLSATREYPDWIDYSTATWREDSPVRQLLRERIELLQRFWRPPESPDPAAFLESSASQFDYLLAMRLHAHSLQVAHKAADRVTPANLQLHVEYYTPFVDWLLSREPSRPAANASPRNTFSVTFLALYDTLITRNRQDPKSSQWNLFTPHSGSPSPSVVDALDRLGQQATAGWPHLRAAYAADWGDWLRDLPFFGTRPAEPAVVNALRAQTGAMGPAWLTHEKDSTGRPGYPAFYGLVSLESWRNTSFRRDLSDWRRRLPLDLKLLERDPAALSDDERDLVGAFWQEIAGFLSGGDPRLGCAQPEADRLAAWLRDLYYQHQVAEAFLVSIAPDRFKMSGFGWQFTPPSSETVRWIAVRKLLLDAFDWDVGSLDQQTIEASSPGVESDVDTLIDAGQTYDDDADIVAVGQLVFGEVEPDSPAHRALDGLVERLVRVMAAVDAALAGTDRGPLPPGLADLEAYVARRNNAAAWYPRAPVGIDAANLPAAVASTEALVAQPAVAEALRDFRDYVRKTASNRLNGHVAAEFFRLLEPRLASHEQADDPLRAILCAEDGVASALSGVGFWWVGGARGPRHITSRGTLTP